MAAGNIHAPEPRTDREYLIEIYSAIRALDTKLTTETARTEEHEHRIGSLESWQARAVGALAIISAVFAVAGGVIGRMIWP